MGKLLGRAYKRWMMGKTCAFLGNADIIGDVRELADKIRQTATDLITNKQVDTFLVGIKGKFETLSHKMMEQIQCDYPNIKIMLVIAYERDLEKVAYKFDDIYYPPQAEFGYRGWSIAKRNDWIIDQTDYVIAYNEYQGRAYNYCKKAKRKGKIIIGLGKQDETI